MKNLPPVLYTFPGSGNTWCRLLIEYATGVFTGSIYGDAQLKKIMPGERYVRACPFAIRNIYIVLCCIFYGLTNLSVLVPDAARA